jgi:4-amino-4-deoxy-L-arabinose transferase-like glycosyltransferase
MTMSGEKPNTLADQSGSAVLKLIGDKRFVVCLSVVLTAAFALRFTLRYYAGAADFWENGYNFFFDLAQNIAAGDGFAFPGRAPTAFRVPLYPLFLAGVTWGHKSFLPLLIAQSLIGTGTVLCAALLAREMFDQFVGLVAAVLTAIYPYFVVHDTALQETGLFTFLTILSVLLLMRTVRTGSTAYAFASGLALGAAILTRATLEPFALFAVVWLAWLNRRESVWRRGLRNGLICLAATSAVLAPWLIRSHSITGAWTLGTEFGAAVWGGNNPATFVYYPVESIDLSRALAMESLSAEDKSELLKLDGNEVAVSDWFLNKGLDYIELHRWQTLINGFRKNVAAFGLLPSPRHGFLPNVIHLFSYGPMLVLGLRGMWLTRREWRVHLLIYGLFLTFVGITALLWAHTSHRVYLDVYLIVFAAAALCRTLPNLPFFSKLWPSRDRAYRR